MLFKNLVQPLGVFKSAAQFLEVFFGCLFNRFVSGIFDTALILFQILLIRENGQDIARRIEDAPYNSLAQCHFRGCTHIKSSRRVLLPVQIAYVRCGQPDHNRIP